MGGGGGGGGGRRRGGGVLGDLFFIFRLPLKTDHGEHDP